MSVAESPMRTHSWGWVWSSRMAASTGAGLGFMLVGSASVAANDGADVYVEPVRDQVLGHGVGAVVGHDRDAAPGMVRGHDDFPGVRGGLGAGDGVHLGGAEGVVDPAHDDQLVQGG